MRRYWFFILLLYACANPIPPTGGPKDLDPPVLLSTDPENKTLNFDGDQVTLVFDEYIKEENLLTQLMITPGLESPYEYKINRNQFTITFPDELDSATTYSLNFREGIKDITEGNVPPNLKFVFSTGNFLDSAAITGVVRNLMTKELLEEITISLYIDPDTNTVFDAPPRYSTLSDENGFYAIENIKNGQYLVYSVNDENRNLKLESRSEGYGFLDQSLTLDDSLSSIDLFIFNLDTRPIVLQNSRPVGVNYEIKFNKALAGYELHTDYNSLVHNLIEENQTLRIYYNQSITDSLALEFTVTDSLNQRLDSLVYVKFEESSRKPDKFTHQLSNKGGPINKDWQTTLKFNKPIDHFNYDSIYFRFDSVYYVPLHDSLFVSNYSNDEYSVTFDFNSYLSEDSIFTNWSSGFEFIIAKGSIISVEQDSIPEVSAKYNFKDPKDFGIIRGAINTQYQSYTIQLVDSKFEVVEELSSSNINNNNYQFLHIEPGNYSIRVLIDENNNGIWEPGNVLNQQPPEKVEVFFHENTDQQKINLRANWEQSGLDIVF